MDEKILLRIYESLANGSSAALVVITQGNGSTPRQSGSLMAVWENGESLGSVGGGKVEYLIIEKAIECIKAGEDINFEYKLNEEGGLGMQCGGEIKGYVKVFRPKNKLIIAGGGHIGEKLNKLAKVIDFHTVILDDRSEYANKDRFEDADEIIIGDIGETLANYHLSENDFVVIITRGYLQDKDALKSAISQNPAYIGMIGSARKIIHLMKELMDEGVSREALQKVYAPVGLDISSNFPGEIAIGILSEILLIKNNGTLNHRKNLKKIWD